MSDDANGTLDACHCCDSPTDAPLDNRPGLPALSYRIGTWATFLDKMKLALAAPGPLAALTTRAPDDPTLAILDSWAVVTDILTFYQERIANEGYLRTATELRSILELARAIGYELNPGVAASTYMAFTVDQPLSSPMPTVMTLPTGPRIQNIQMQTPDTITLPAGTRAQSVPAGSELPQSFESTEDLEARAAWNLMAPKTTQRQRLQVAADGTLQRIDPATGTGVVATSLYFSGTQTNLRVGDLILVQVESANHQQNDSVTPTDGRVCLYVTAVVADFTGKTTRVDLAQDGASDPPFSLPPQTAGVVDLTPVSLTPDVVRSQIIGQDWTEPNLAAWIDVQGWDPRDVLSQVSALLAADPAPADVWAFRSRSGVFGHSAPPWISINQAFQGAPPVPWDKSWDNPPLAVWTNSARTNYSTVYGGLDIFLDRVLSTVTKGGWVALAGTPSSQQTFTKSIGGPPTILFEAKKKKAQGGLSKSTPQAQLEAQAQSQFGMSTALTPPAAPTPYLVERTSETSLADFGIASKATGVRLLDPTQSPPTHLADADKSSGYGMRQTTVFAQSEELDLVPAPIADAITNDGPAAVVTLENMVLGLAAGRKVAWTGMPIDPTTQNTTGVTVTEILTIESVLHSRGYTTITFAEKLEHSYSRTTVFLNANIASATHGATTANETLGSGDGSKPNQAFVLKGSPLTFVSAPTPSGGLSTLTVRVGGVEWTEVPSLYTAGPTDRVYISRQEPDGTTRVTFGDGVRGARVPSGRDNVSATYRVGTGTVGEVAANVITILQSKPLGLKNTLNPVAATGAADPEQLSGARENAPRTVRTLDRLVSLDDFEDFTRSFAGIGKAQATPIWDGEQQMVHLTIGAATGGAVDPESQLYQNLIAGIQNASDGRHKVLADSYQARFFRLSCSVIVDPAYVMPDVVAAVTNALAAAFVYALRDFAQPVTDAEIMQIAQAQAGVVAISISALYYAEDPSSITGVLPSLGAHFDGTTVQPAELLLLHPTGLTVTGENP